jgi:hypothetical protein
VAHASSRLVENWQQAEQPNSPQSVRDAIIYGIAAVLLVAGFFVMRFVLTTVADDASGSAVKGKVTPCRTR